ncbi:hypothetical protein M413DRAFT_198213 [Hebeloma cylindrosporum]|uniref:Uncharacterized protein n=1 Tax=Hebeloma cylindrosporum TaxID=76867 RepID=A0A0C3C537_HEBCY|nr:hypothetical protein M413DRAFT_198213 [Hebeloma cylindrosporum h7]
MWTTAAIEPQLPIYISTFRWFPKISSHCFGAFESSDHPKQFCVLSLPSISFSSP